MARIHENFDEYRHGKLVVKECQPNCVEVFYIPSKEKLKQSGLTSNKEAEHCVKLLIINGQEQTLTIFPTNTLGGHDNFLKPKYDQVERITLADGGIAYAHVNNTDPSNIDEVFMYPYFGPTEPLTPDEVEALPDIDDIDSTIPSTTEEVMMVLEDLPLAFTKDYDYGLGLAKSYRFIIDAVEALSDCTEIVISRTCGTRIDQRNKIFYIATDDFETARKNLNSITRLGRSAMRSVKDATTYNLLAQKIGQPEIPVEIGRNPLRKIFTAAVQNKAALTENQQEEMISVVTKSARTIAETNPEKLAKLQSDIELVTLERLILRYEEMIGQRLREQDWQVFFTENPFILSLAFGYPVIKVQDQASVGGRKLSGLGDKIADFLVKNSMTNNTAIFEIKTPQAGLLKKTPFRNGIYTPSSELAGAINQALDQKYQFQTHIASVKHNSRIYDMESYSVHCCLIIGATPSEEDQQKSFELFRGNSKDVEIVTFDELLEKLKQLRDFLEG
ncbi:MAG: DUF4263 domain-containing protein [Gemmatimonadota bacterium]|nr:DUF4263 domain-containing protein [Gemmatimonadota bacterium]